MQGGHKPSHFMAKSNLHELEEHKAHLPVVISEQGCTHGCFLGPTTLPWLLALWEVGKQSR